MELPGLCTRSVSRAHACLLSLGTLGNKRAEEEARSHFVSRDLRGNTGSSSGRRSLCRGHAQPGQRRGRRLAASGPLPAPARGARWAVMSPARAARDADAEEQAHSRTLRSTPARRGSGSRGEGNRL